MPRPQLHCPPSRGRAPHFWTSGLVRVWGGGDPWVVLLGIGRQINAFLSLNHFLEVRKWSQKQTSKVKRNQDISMPTYFMIQLLPLRFVDFIQGLWHTAEWWQLTLSISFHIMLNVRNKSCSSKVPVSVLPPFPYALRTTNISAVTQEPFEC